MKILVIIPCYNEAAVICQTVIQVLDAGYDVAVIDDGSDEDVFQQLEGLPIHYLKHAVNLGQGAALQTGMEYALSQGIEIVVHFDADGQHQAEDIGNMIEPVHTGQVDVVLGSRFMNPHHVKTIPFKRKLLLQMARYTNLLFAGLWLTDAHNGFRALNRNAMQTIRITENGMGHAIEILQQINTHKLKYCERPTRVVYTDYSKKKGQSLWNAVNIFIYLVLNRK